ncbi:hypothetical protein N7452_008037, partial [Penicillium brevicompactum]
MVEMKLLCTLPGIFNLVTAFDMSEEVVTQIVGESEESRSLREQLNKKLRVLAKGSDTCRRFVDIRGMEFPNESSESNNPRATQSSSGSRSPFEEVENTAIPEHDDQNEYSESLSSGNAAAAVPDALDCPEPEPAVDSLELPEESTY